MSGINDKTDDVLKPLPMRKDIAPALVAEGSDAPQRDIYKTTGGKTINWFIYYGLGWILNSSLSLLFTYGFNPRPGVKTFKDNATNFFSRMFGGANAARIHDSVRSTVELCFMFIAGCIATGIMTPLVSRRDKIAYWLNRKVFHKDTGVLPDHLKTPVAPKTLEDQIEQQIDLRVNKKHSAFDLWIARAVSMAAIMAGDFGVNRWSRGLEASGKQSVDTLSWRGGQKAYNLLPEGFSRRVNGWFSRHGASIGDMEKNMKDHFGRLRETEQAYGAQGGTPNEDRMVTSEQTRIITKEWGWALVCATFVNKLTNLIRDQRVHWQRKKAVQELTAQGMVPEGYRVVFDEKVRLERTSSQAPAGTSWSEKPGTPRKAESHAQRIETAEPAAVGVQA